MFIPEVLGLQSPMTNNNWLLVVFSSSCVSFGDGVFIRPIMDKSNDLFLPRGSNSLVVPLGLLFPVGA